MKEVTQDYIDAEEAVQRKPVELYKFWRTGGEVWSYTDGDIAVTYDSTVYNPATLSRGSVRYNSKLESQVLKINAHSLENATLNFIAQNPVEVIWVSVLKLHRDQSPLEADVIFIGQIKSVLFKGVSANVNCVGFEHFLKKIIPSWRYQKNCNHKVFDDNCALTKSSFKTTTAINLDSTGFLLTSADFGLEDDGFFTRGEVVYGEESRTIASHEGNTIVLFYKMLTLEDGFTVDVYPGCDGRKETCYSTFNNIVNFLGFPFIPEENPALRVSW